MTIKELTEDLFIDLSLTGGNGLYLSSSKEKLWPERRIVIFDKQTGIMYACIHTPLRPGSSIEIEYWVY